MYRCTHGIHSSQLHNYACQSSGVTIWKIIGSRKDIKNLPIIIVCQCSKGVKFRTAGKNVACLPVISEKGRLKLQQQKNSHLQERMRIIKSIKVHGTCYVVLTNSLKQLTFKKINDEYNESHPCPDFRHYISN